MKATGSVAALRAGTSVVVLCALVGLANALSCDAVASATFTAQIDAQLTVVTDPIVNQFGFTPFSGTTTSNVDPSGNGGGSAGATAPVISTGIQGLSMVSGTASPFGTVTSLASTIGKINLANLTGSGPPTPPGAPLTVLLNLDFTFSLSVSADTPCEEAYAYIAFDVAGGGAAFSAPPTSLFVVGPGADATSGSGSVSLPITLPQNSITAVYLRTEAYGFAFAAFCDPPEPPPPPPPPPPLPPYPEPGTATLLLSALPFGLLCLYRRRRR